MQSKKKIDIKYCYYDGFAKIKSPTRKSQQVVKNLFYDGFGLIQEQNQYINLTFLLRTVRLK